jgi:NADH dehydrogenase FAD-containing subunit
LFQEYGGDQVVGYPAPVSYATPCWGGCFTISYSLSKGSLYHAAMTSTHRILIIDDDARLCELLLRYLGEQGYEVKAVADRSKLVDAFMRRLGDSKGLFESAMRDKHIKWICNAKINKIEADKMFVTEFDDMRKEKTTHELPFAYSMVLPAFKGVDAVFGIEGLTNPRGFILVDEHQRNSKFKNIYAVVVCIAIPPVKKMPVPIATPKTGYMIESMVTAAAHNIHSELTGNFGHLCTLRLEWLENIAVMQEQFQRVFHIGGVILGSTGLKSLAVLRQR